MLDRPTAEMAPQQVHHLAVLDRRRSPDHELSVEDLVAQVSVELALSLETLQQRVRHAGAGSDNHARSSRSIRRR